MERRKFTREFKLEAATDQRAGGVVCASLARSRVHQSQLRVWVKALADDPQHAFRAKAR
jgi:transposase-like protein